MLICNLHVCFGPDVNVQMKVSGGAWVLANLDISGYYRVNYDLPNWERLISLLGNNHKVKSRPGDLPAFTHTEGTWTSPHVCLCLCNSFLSTWSPQQPFQWNWYSHVV